MEYLLYRPQQYHNVHNPLLSLEPTTVQLQYLLVGKERFPFFAAPLSHLNNRSRAFFIHTLTTGRYYDVNQFNSLDEEKQAIEICKSICVAGRDEGELKVLLFQIDSFYVEIFYDPRKKL